MPRPLPGAIVVVVTILAASSARAADIPLRSAPPVFVEQNWSGLYFGAQIGSVVDGRRGRTVASGDGGLVILPGFGGRGGRTGNAVGVIEKRNLFTGGHLGYNWQSGSAVYGLEGDIDTLGPIDDILASARTRLGFGSSNFVVYGTAGVTFQSLNESTVGVFVGGNGGNGGNGGLGGDGGAGGNGFGSLPLTRNGNGRVGFVGGGGFEARVSPQVSAGIEALYYTFDGAPVVTGLPRDFLTVRGRLTFHLNPADVASPVPSVSFANWAGSYAGGHFGGLYNLLDTAIASTSLANGEAGTSGVRGIDGGGGGGGAVAFAALQKNPSILGGIHLGYNWQSPGMVYGGEADASFSPDDNHRYLGTIRGRVGFASASYLFFGTAGVAFNGSDRVRAIFAGNGGAGGDGGAVLAAPGGAGGLGGQALAVGRSETQVGFVVGGGLEAKISERVSAGIEGLYYNFGDRSVPILPSVNSGRSVTSNGNADAFVLRTRLSFSFQR